jgi:hypothetical protein
MTLVTLWILSNVLQLRKKNSPLRGVLNYESLTIVRLTVLVVDPAVGLANLHCNFEVRWRRCICANEHVMPAYADITDAVGKAAQSAVETAGGVKTVVKTPRSTSASTAAAGCAP